MSFLSKIEKYKSGFISESQAVSETDSYFIDSYIKLKNKDFKPESFSGEFIPGKIYIFRYNPDQTKERKEGFINRMPILLSFGVKQTKDLNSILYGVDLIATPPDERIKILNKIYEYGKETIESNIEAYKKSGVQSPLNLKGDTIKSLLEDTGYYSSFKGFTVSSISSPYIINYSDWEKLPYLSVALLQGSSPSEIYTEYRSKLKYKSDLKDKNK